jgi:hypothetical protein
VRAWRAIGSGNPDGPDTEDPNAIVVRNPSASSIDGRAKSLLSDPGEGGSAIPGNSLAEVIEKSCRDHRVPGFLESGFRLNGQDPDTAEAHDTADSMARCPSLPRHRTDESTSPAPIAKYASRRKIAILREDFAFLRFEFRIRTISPESGALLKK